MLKRFVISWSWPHVDARSPPGEPGTLHRSRRRILHGSKFGSVLQKCLITASSDATCRHPKTFMTATPLKPNPPFRDPDCTSKEGEWTQKWTNTPKCKDVHPIRCCMFEVMPFAAMICNVPNHVFNNQFGSKKNSIPSKWTRRVWVANCC